MKPLEASRIDAILVAQGSQHDNERWAVFVSPTDDAGQVAEEFVWERPAVDVTRLASIAPALNGQRSSRVWSLGSGSRRHPVGFLVVTTDETTSGLTLRYRNAPDDHRALNIAAQWPATTTVFRLQDGQEPTELVLHRARDEALESVPIVDPRTVMNV